MMRAHLATTILFFNLSLWAASATAGPATPTPTSQHGCTKVLLESPKGWPEPPYVAPTFAPLPPQHPQVQYRLARTPRHLREMTLPGDRLVLRLSPELEKLPWSLLSHQGQTELRKMLLHISAEETFSSIAEKFQISRAETEQMMSIDGEALIHKMLEERNAEQWTKVIDIYEKELVGIWQKVSEAKLIAALSYNRRNQNDDREEALRLTKEVIAQSVGKSLISEAYGIRARIFKDIYDETGNRADLDLAIQTYLTGYDSNPNDYYPGVAALNLMLLKYPISSPVIQDLLARLLMTTNTTRKRFSEKGLLPDYWLISTELRLRVLRSQWDEAFRLVPDMLANSAGPQNLNSSLKDYERLLNNPDFVTTQENRRRLQDFVDLLKTAASQKQDDFQLSENSPSYVATQSFVSTEGVFLTDPFNLYEEIQKSEIEDDLNILAKDGTVQIESFHKYLQTPGEIATRAQHILLAPTGPYRDAVQIISDQTRMTPWWDAYKLAGLPADPAHTEEFLKRTLQAGRHVHLLVPHHFQSLHAGSHTLKEFEVLTRLFKTYSKQIHFVFGFEKVYPFEYQRRLSPEEVHKTYANNITRFFTNRYAQWLTKLGKKVRAYRFGLDFKSSLYPIIYNQVLQHLSFHQEMRALHSQYVQHSTNGEPVHLLDLGGGTGLITRQLIADDPQRVVEIFDTSDVMTTVAKSKGQPAQMVHNSSITDLRRSDGEKVESESVDGATCSNVIYLLSKADVNEFLKEVHRVLKRGGRLTLSSMRDVPLDVHIDFLAQATAETKEYEQKGLVPAGGSHILGSANQQLLNQIPSLFSIEAISSLGQQFGFKVIAQRTVYGEAGFFVVFEKL